MTLDTFNRDLRFAFRGWRRAPGYTALAVATLAVGIGINTTAFSAVNGVLLKDVFAQNPEQLVNIYESRPGLPFNPPSYPDYRDLRDNARGVFSDVAAAQHLFAQADTADGVETVLVELVTGNTFPMLGIEPHAGRLLSEADHVAPGAHPVAVLAYGYWQRAYGGDPRVVGREIRLNGAAYSIVGVAPAGHRSMLRGVRPHLFVPILMINELQATTADALDQRQDYFLIMRGRLAEGSTLTEARQMAESVAASLRRAHPTLWHAEDRFDLVPTSEVIMFPQFDGALTRAAWMLLGGVGVVLLVACSNLASFLLARYVGRTREIAVRRALGATRSRLVGQLLTETLLLIIASAAGGIGLAVWLVGLLENADLPAIVPITFRFTIDTTVLAFTLAVSLGAGLLIGVAPALRATRRDVSSAIRSSGAGIVAGGRRLGLREGLLIGQLALSLVLLVAAGLLGRSYRAVYALDPGFGELPTGVTTVSLPSTHYDEAAGQALLDELRERIAALPGVRSVGATTVLHLSQFPTPFLDVTVDGVAPPPGRDAHRVDWASVDTGFFATTGIEIRRGRNFVSADRPDAQPVAIISEAMAELFWPRADAVGKVVRTTEGEELLVVGVAADAKVKGLIEPPRPYLYRPLEQRYSTTITLLATVDRDLERGAETIARVMMSAVRDLAPDALVVETKTLEEHFDAIRFPVRIVAVASTGLAGLALALASTGLYGLASFNQARRRREVGIRMSLGADARDVVLLLVGDGLKPVLAGGAAGLLGSLAVGRLLSGLLVDVGAWDPATFVASSLVLGGTALIAAWWPAWRASRLDPVRALSE